MSFRRKCLSIGTEDVEEAKRIVNESNKSFEYTPFKPQRVSYHSERHCAVWHHRGVSGVQICHRHRGLSKWTPCEVQKKHPAVDAGGPCEGQSAMEQKQ